MAFCKFWGLGSIIMLLLWSSILLHPHVLAGYAPDTAPELPKGFCPKETGDITATTGECMCHWQDRRGCQGSGCQFEMGLSWYHYSCNDCKCIPEPKS